MNVCLQDTPVILIQTPDKNNNEEKKCMFQTSLWGVGTSSVSYKKGLPRGVPPVFLLEVQYSILKSLISTCVLSYVGSREDWLLDRICRDRKRRASYPYQLVER